MILVVVDRLSKYAHFMPLAHPYTTMDVAQVFLDSLRSTCNASLNCVRRGCGFHKSFLAGAISFTENQA